MNAIFLVLRGLFSIWNFARITKTQQFLYFALNIGIALFIGYFLFVMPNPLLFLAVFLIQWAVLYRVRKMMGVQVAGESDEFLPEGKAEEVLNPTTPTFVTFNAHSSINEFSHYRERIVEEARADLKRKLRRDVLLAVGCFGLFCGAMTLFTPAEDNFQGLWLLAAVFLSGIWLLISVVIRGLFMQNQYRPADTKFELALVKNPINFYGQELANLLHKGGIDVLIGFILVLIDFHCGN